MGIILYKMLYGKEPYYGSSTIELLEQIKRNELEFPKEISVSEDTICLMKKMIERDEKARISFKMLKEIIVKENM